MESNKFTSKNDTHINRFSNSWLILTCNALFSLRIFMFYFSCQKIGKKKKSFRYTNMKVYFYYSDNFFLFFFTKIKVENVWHIIYTDNGSLNRTESIIKIGWWFSHYIRWLDGNWRIGILTNRYIINYWQIDIFDNLNVISSQINILTSF